MIIKIKKGLDLPLAGRPEQVIDDAPAVSRVAVLGRDFVGLKPGMLVASGDRVSAGQPLFFDKRDEAVKFTAPASGTVSSFCGVPPPIGSAGSCVGAERSASNTSGSVIETPWMIWRTA